MHSAPYCEYVLLFCVKFDFIRKKRRCSETLPLHVLRYHGAVLGRVYHALSFYPIIDLISILPNWISLASYILDPFFTGEQYIESPDFTTAARIFRLVRIFKTDKYINAFSLLGTVLWDNRVLLLATSFYSSMIWVISATLLYYTERDNVDPEMQMHFQSIPGMR